MKLYCKLLFTVAKNYKHIEILPQLSYDYMKEVGWSIHIGWLLWTIRITNRRYYY
ncbi:MAG: hypothetical protein PUJ51_10440 [Clostridiales bacterium]|jgi:hypothetical protein|uniref:hypothetical protein n=1 Tax=Terrisporobacter sp. TaxID=1965305 RepID=UPI002A54C1A9|nr:hypothetical protein [Terrisporobacter sp.]MDD7754904.1 hypothetical protein [Clostridiales bacterium]MDY4134702.1 hypothetical protein [Terrisporobacter sp.]